MTDSNLDPIREEDPAAGPETAPDREPPVRLSIQHVWETYGSLLRSGLMLAVFFAALWLLHHEFQTARHDDIAASFAALSMGSILAAIGLTAANFAVLIGYDWFGVRLVEHPVPNRQVAMASLLSHSFSNTLGTYLGGAPVRVRLYSDLGMPVSQIARLVLVIGVAFWMGLCLLAGLLFILAPFSIPDRFQLPLDSSRPLGVVLLLLLILFLLVCHLRKSPLSVMGVNLQPPPLKIALAQLIVAAADIVLAASVLYILLPAGMQIGFWPFVAVYALALCLGLMSHVPGGLGVFELVMVTMLPGEPHALVGALVAYRLIYYVLPLMLGVLAVSAITAWRHAAKMAGTATIGMRWIAVLGPRVLTLAVFAAGAILLISGTFPVPGHRIDQTEASLPLSLLEFSHFLSSVVGALLLVVARSLQRRIDAAYWIAIGLLACAAVLSLINSAHYGMAFLFAALLLVLLPCRSYFYRPGRLLATIGSFRWLVSVLMLGGLLIWLILFAHRHTDYSHDLWWSFEIDGDASRSLRAAVGAAIVIVLFLLADMLRVARALPPGPTGEELQAAEAIIASDDRTESNLALLGDKRFVFSSDRQAFIMYAGEGNSWISMGDPVGPAQSADDAAWSFREACDAQGVWPVFYQVGEASLGRYIEMGLSMLKLGEEARVPLSGFSLQTCSKSVRRTNNKSLESGLQFNVVTRDEVGAWMPSLREVSDAWLGGKSAAEKGFSLGWFDEDYLSLFDIAMVIKDERPIAFANIWRARQGTEVSVDLMRHLPHAHRSVMEFLFVQLMLWGREQGYAHFNLGMAPLSGVDAHRLGPAWNRLSHVIYQHGEHFYNFQGLRAYKQKFHPDWSPRYLASPGGIATPRILADVSTLISGGLVRLIKR